MPADTDRSLMRYLIISNFLLAFGFQVWQALFNNFAVEQLGIGPAAVGLVQAVREVPGLVGVLLGVVALYLSEVRIMAASIILMGLGVAATGFSSSLGILLVSTLVMSTGFHFFLPASNAVVLMAVVQREAPRALGSLGSLSAFASLAGTGAVFFLARPLGYRVLFLAVGLLVVAGGLILLSMGRRDGGLPPVRKIVLRRRYWLYYTLSFLLGSRRHIFTTFALFLLVREHGIGVQTTAVLFLVNSIVSIYTLRLSGRLVSRLGERQVLSFAFAALTLVFLGYAYVTWLPALFALFVLDNVLFGVNLALMTYFQKIAVTQEEITTNLSVEQGINHIAAVIIPLIGGAAWELLGVQAPFLVGAGLVLVALVLTQFIRTPAICGRSAPAVE